MKWRSAYGVLCDRNMPLQLEGNSIRSLFKLLYRIEVSIFIARQNKNGFHRDEYIDMDGMKNKLDKIKNGKMQTKLGVALIEDKLRESIKTIQTLDV